MKLLEAGSLVAVPDARCPVCGHNRFAFTPVLWQSLIRDWQLSEAEAHYTDLQQGYHCMQCKANLRSMTLAHAICRAYHFEGLLDEWISNERFQAERLLEMNSAGSLTKHLRPHPGYFFAAYPEVDMHALPYGTGEFNLIIHSDTLEHVPNPIHALAECRRVLTPGGYLAFTIPVIPERLSRSRDGLPPSFHGRADQEADDYRVQTEFGADAWTFPLRAGFNEVTLCSLSYPASVAFLARA